MYGKFCNGTLNIVYQLLFIHIIKLIYVVDLNFYIAEFVLIL